MILRGNRLFSVGPLALVTLALLGSPLLAGPISFTDVYDPANVLLDKRTNSQYSFSHDINDDGFNSQTDTLTFASIVIDFEDDSPNKSDGSEVIQFRLDGDNFGTYKVESSPGVAFFIDVAYLQSDGLLTVTLRQTAGDVYFEKSTLTVEGIRTTPGAGSAPHMPEPATLLLLGLGAAAAGIASRRKYGKSQNKVRKG